MVYFLILQTFKSLKADGRSYIIFRSGEKHSLDALSVEFNEKAICELQEKNYIQKVSTNQIEVDTQPQIETVTEIMPVENQAPEQQEQVFETVYTVRETLQDKDGNEIEVDTQLTAKEIKEKGLKRSALIKEGKLMEIKIVK
jgi:hypothetical protein